MSDDRWKIGIGQIHHHRLQVESADEFTDLARIALKHITAERLVLRSDSKTGREGMSRRHAFYKTVSLVRGANLVRREVGAPEAECLAADPKFSLIRS